MESPLIISASGIRGIVGKTVTPELAARYGAALGSFLRETGMAVDGSYVLVGRDSRTTGALLADAAAAGICATGINVRLTGIGPTPTHLLAVKDDDQAIGGLIVTASHNPVEWNGLKLAGADGLFVTPASGERIAHLFRAGPAYGDWSGPGHVSQYEGVVEHHIDRILGLDLVATEAIRKARPKVVVDCVHGAGALVVPELLRRLGAEVDGIGLTADGRFPRNPEPVPENLGELSARVRESGADIGFAVDPDSDRLAIVDENGTAIGEDWTLALAVEYALGVNSGPVVTNLSSSQCIEDVAKAAGVDFYRSSVGEARVAAMMTEVGAIIGGEGNGGVMLPELNLTRDAPLACALVLSLCAERDVRVGELLSGRSRYETVKAKIPVPDTPIEEILGTLAASMGSDAESDSTDGLRLSWPDRSEWLHVRASGTEPILRVIAESTDVSRAESLAAQAQESVARAVGSIE